MSKDLSFTAATWNFGGGEPKGGPTELESQHLLAELRKRNASVILGQEAQEAQDRSFLESIGYQVYRAYQESIVAWLPTMWTLCSKREVVLNPVNPFYRPGSDRPVYVRCAKVVLCDPLGRSIDALSYHTPSSVQRADPPERRREALEACMKNLTALAADSEAKAVLFGGDDNVDETGPHGPWGFMRRRATGLRLLQAPRATLGSRKVDDFRVRGLAPEGKGVVLKGPTHHNAHVRRLRWTD